MKTLNNLVNWIKVGLILTADKINTLYYPFVEAPAFEPSPEATKLEPLFYADLESRFMQPWGEFYYELPRPADAGDTALFQGLVTSMKILKGVDVTKQVNFISRLFVNGALIRGYDNNNQPNDTTSNDSATGMLFFFYTAFWFGDNETVLKAGALLRSWASSIKAHNYALVDLNGNPTQYGKLENGLLTDPLRITLLCAIFAMAASFDPFFYQDYDELVEKYKPILKYPKVNLLWLGQDYDTHRAAIHLHVLYAMTGEDMYRDGLKRIWNITKHENNAWVYVLCAPGFEYGELDGNYLRKILCTFDYTARSKGNIEALNPDSPKSSYWGGKDRSKYALPFYKRGSQDFFWQRNAFSRNEWVGNKEAGVYHSGLDFLLCAWMANRLGIFK